jgi:hypothetical protein
MHGVPFAREHEACARAAVGAEQGEPGRAAAVERHAHAVVTLLVAQREGDGPVGRVAREDGALTTDVVAQDEALGRQGHGRAVLPRERQREAERERARRRATPATERALESSQARLEQILVGGHGSPSRPPSVCATNIESSERLRARPTVTSSRPAQPRSLPA